MLLVNAVSLKLIVANKLLFRAKILLNHILPEEKGGMLSGYYPVMTNILQAITSNDRRKTINQAVAATRVTKVKVVMILFLV